MHESNSFLGKAFRLVALLLAVSLVHTIAFPIGAALGERVQRFNFDGGKATTADSRAPNTAVSKIEETAQNSSQSPAESAKLLLIVLAVSLLNASVLVLVLKQTRSSWLGTTAILSLSFFACMTFFSQTEVFFFIKNPWPILKLTLTMGAVVSLSTSAFAALFRVSRSADSQAEVHSPAWISLRSMSLVPLYAVLYLTFGYFVAWQSESVREFYSGSNQLLGFWEHMSSPATTQRVLPLQLVRGFLWSMLFVFMGRNLVGHPRTIAIAVALAAAVWMNAQLLLPNPYMPNDVRMIHLIETASSNLIFGYIGMLILLRRDAVKIDETDLARD